MAMGCEYSVWKKTTGTAIFNAAEEHSLANERFKIDMKILS